MATWKRQWAIASMLGLLVLMCVFYFASFPLARWAAMEWQRQSPIPGVKIDIVSMSFTEGRVSVSIEGVAEALLVPFAWRWKLFPPSLALSFGKKSPRVVGTGFLIEESEVDATLLLPLSGRWNLDAKATIGRGEWQGIRMDRFSGRLGVGASGGVSDGSVRVGTSEISWDLRLREIDLKQSIPCEIDGSVKVRDAVGQASSTIDWKRSGELRGSIFPGSLFRPKVSLDSSLDWRVPRFDGKKNVQILASCGERKFGCLKAAIGGVSHRLGRLEARLDVEASSTPAKLRAQVQWNALQIPSLLPELSTKPWEISGVMNAAGTGTSDATADVQVTAAGLPSVGRGRGWVRGSHRGAFSFHLPLKFSADKLLPPLLGALKNDLEGLEGALDLKGTGELTPGGAILAWSLASDGLSGSWSKIPFDIERVRMSGEGYPRFRSLGSNELVVKSVGESFPLEAVRAEFVWEDAKAIQIRRLTALLGGGSLRFEPFTWNREGRTASRAELKNAELSILAPALLGESVEASGKIEGEFPWSLEHDTLKIAKAEIRNQDEGRIQYSDERIRGVKAKIDYLDEFNDLLAQGQQMLVLKALHNFHYSVLTVGLDRSVESGLRVVLHLKGKNPDLAKGQPFDIALPVSGSVEPLVRETILKAFLGE